MPAGTVAPETERENGIEYTRSFVGVNAMDITPEVAPEGIFTERVPAPHVHSRVSPVFNAADA